MRKEVIVEVVNAPMVDFSVSNPMGCAPHCVAFQNLSTPTSAPIISYMWSANGEFFSDVQEPDHCFSAGIYHIELLVVDAIGCTKSVTKPSFVSVVPGPVANFAVSHIETAEEDAFIVFTSINPRSDETIVWDMGDGTSDTGFIASHFFPEAGRYCIRQTVTGAYGCSDSKERCVSITSEFHVYVPNAFTPTQDGINDVWQPVIKGKYTSYQASVFNRWGERVFFTDDINTPWVGDIEGGKYYYVPDGVYHFLIIVEDKEQVPHEYRGQVRLLR